MTEHTNISVKSLPFTYKTKYTLVAENLENLLREDGFYCFKLNYKEAFSAISPVIIHIDRGNYQVVTNYPRKYRSEWIPDPSSVFAVVRRLTNKL